MQIKKKKTIERKKKHRVYSGPRMSLVKVKEPTYPKSMNRNKSIQKNGVADNWLNIAN